MVVMVCPCNDLSPALLFCLVFCLVLVPPFLPHLVSCNEHAFVAFFFSRLLIVGRNLVWCPLDCVCISLCRVVRFLLVIASLISSLVLQFGFRNLVRGIHSHPTGSPETHLMTPKSESLGLVIGAHVDSQASTA